MAERRMFAKTIINSARFLKMPSETQALYFHLALNADDDGVVEAFSICRSIGASEDNLKILVAKNFVNVLNDDLVTHIMDWNTHNKIRADRKVDSIYKDLLLQLNPSIELVEKKQRADRKNLGTDNGRTMDSIGKDSIGKDSIGKIETLRNYIDDALLPDLNLQAFDEWIEYKKYDYKKIGITKIVNMLTKYSYQEQQKIIDRSIMNNYTGLVEPKTNRNTAKTNNRNNFNDLVDNYFSKPYDGDMEDCEVIE